MRRALRVVHGDKELLEKLGRNDPCPCGSGKPFQEVLPEVGLLLTGLIAAITSADVSAQRPVLTGSFIKKNLYGALRYTHRAFPWWEHGRLTCSGPDS